MDVKANIGYNERKHVYLYRMFRVINELPIIGEDLFGGGEISPILNIEKVEIDSYNDSDKFKYDYYAITFHWKAFDEIDIEYVAIKKEEV